MENFLWIFGAQKFKNESLFSVRSESSMGSHFYFKISKDGFK